MFRNQYDTDVTVWSPEGRLLQVGCCLRWLDCGLSCNLLCGLCVIQVCLVSLAVFCVSFFAGDSNSDLI